MQVGFPENLAQNQRTDVVSFRCLFNPKTKKLGGEFFEDFLKKTSRQAVWSHMRKRQIVLMIDGMDVGYLTNIASETPAPLLCSLHI